VLLQTAGGGLRHHRFSAQELTAAHRFWHERLQAALDEFPMAWAAPIWPASKEAR
jgi:hypothetical protein